MNKLGIYTTKCDGCDGCVTDVFSLCVTALALMCQRFSQCVTDVTDKPSCVCVRARVLRVLCVTSVTVVFYINKSITYLVTLPFFLSVTIRHIRHSHFFSKFGGVMREVNISQLPKQKKQQVWAWVRANRPEQAKLILSESFQATMAAFNGEVIIELEG